MSRMQTNKVDNNLNPIIQINNTSPWQKVARTVCIIAVAALLLFPGSWFLYEGAYAASVGYIFGIALLAKGCIWIKDYQALSTKQKSIPNINTVLTEVIQKGVETPAPPPPPPIKKVAFGTSNYNPDQKLLQFFINDYVGGGKGNSLDDAVSLYRHYLDKYCEEFPSDMQAKNIQDLLSNYYEISSQISIQDAASEILSRLEKNKYVAFTGGYYNSDSGHAIFYELFLNEKNEVTLKITNSGDGLQFHPTKKNLPNELTTYDCRYRTLVFSGASLESLKACPYLEALVSYTRPRAPYKEFPKLGIRKETTWLKVKNLYSFLFYAWPGISTIVAENPGHAQRAKSCSVQALKKWVKGNYPASQLMSFWISVSQLSDYISNEKQICSSFVEDAIRKISTEASKIKTSGVDDGGMLAAWILIAQKAQNSLGQARAQEAAQLKADSLQLPPEGIDLSQVDIVDWKPGSDSSEEENKKIQITFDHRLPGEAPNYAILPQLSQSYIANLQDETVSRLNFFRLLPDFQNFNFERDVSNYDRNKFFTDLLTTTQKFFYTGDRDSIHLPDSFLADLLNAWLIGYLEAKKQALIPPQVLLEWIEGVIVLTQAYNPEYVFDKPESFGRFKEALNFSEKEKCALLVQLGPYYVPRKNYWEVYDRNFTTWMSFGSHWYEEKKGDKLYHPKKKKELPESAIFALEKMQAYLQSGNKDDPAFEKKLKKIIEDNEGKDALKAYIGKAIAMFGIELPGVPLYDPLRLSLAGLYGFADRYLIMNNLIRSNLLSKNDNPSAKLTNLISDELVIGIGYMQCRRPSVKGNPINDPEYYLPKSAKQTQELKDFNQRIQTIFSTPTRNLPFFKKQEESEYVAFVQNDAATCLSELLSFAHSKIAKFADPIYLRTFEHALFGSEGYQILETVFSESSSNPNSPLSRGSVDMVFNFTHNAITKALKFKGKGKEAAVAFLYIHTRLCYLAEYYKHPDAPSYLEQLLELWTLILNESKQKDALAKTLGESVVASLTVMESMPQLYMQPKFAKLLAMTILLECEKEPAAYRSKQDDITLHYGNQTFKTILSRQNNSAQIWKEAAQEILGISLKTACEWDVERGLLKLDHLTVDLAARVIDDEDDTKMRLIPKEITNGYPCERYFGSKRILSKFKRNGCEHVYTFRYRQCDYQIIYNDKTKKKILLKKYGNEFFRSASLISAHIFITDNHLWSQSGGCVIVENASNNVIAIKDEKGYRRLKRQQPTQDLLATFGSHKSPLRALISRIESPKDTMIWCNEKTKKVSRIELPKLNLKLIVKVKKGKTLLTCRQFPGYFVSNDQHVDFLKNLTKYLVLENDLGQKKIIVPARFIQNDHILLDIKGLKEVPYVAYDLDVGQTDPYIRPSTIQVPAAMLIYLYLTTKQYQKAYDLLKLVDFKKLDSASQEIFGWTTFFCKDKHPFAVALRLHFGKNEDDMQRFEDLYHHINNFKPPESDLETLRLRKCEIVRQPFPDSFDLGYYVPYFEWIWGVREKISAQAMDQAKEPVSYAAIGEDIVLNFIAYYRMAKEGNTADKNKIRFLIAAVRLETDSDVEKSLSIILAYALEKGSESPSVNEIVELFQTSNEKEFLNKLASIYCSAQAVFKEKTNLSLWYQGKKMTPKFLTSSEDKRTFDPIPRIPDTSFKQFPLFQIPHPEKLYQADVAESLVNEKCDYQFEIESAIQLEAWANQQADLNKNEPVIQHQFLRTAKGARSYVDELEQKPKTRSVLVRDAQKIAGTCRSYEKAIESSKKALDTFREEIEKEANETHENLDVALEFLRGLRTPFDMQMLLIAFGRRDLSAIQNINPALSERQINDLMKKVGTYALMMTHHQKLERCFDKLTAYHEMMNSNGEEHALVEASKEFEEVYFAERAYEPSKHPNLLAFEALLDILIKDEQWKALQTLTNTQEGWKLFEARTGFGKTKAVMPLWMLLMTDQNHLTFVMAPSTLFDQEESYLQTVIQKGYRFFGERIDYSRNFDDNGMDVQSVYEKLKKAQEARKPVFMSDQTAHQLFVLKLKEDASNKVDITHALLLREYVKKNGVVFIDEPHKVLDDQQESNYSLGKPEAFEEWRLLFSLHLYQSFFELLKGKYRLEFFDDPKACHLPPLSETAYREEIVVKLAQTQKVKADALTLRYLLGQMSRDEQELFEKKLNPSDREDVKVRILHDQLHHYLPQTMNKNSNEHYALVDEKDNRCSIPLEDARNPKKGNEFCSPDQIINFTIQANLKTPFSIDYITNFLQELGVQAAAELDADVAHITKTIAYKKFRLLTKGMTTPPRNFIKIAPEEIDTICRHINGDFDARLQFIGMAVLPSIRRYESKVVSTPHLLMQVFKNGYGASGTLSRQNFPHRFEIEHDHKAMAKTLVTLLRKKTPVIEIQQSGSAKILAKLPEFIGQASVLIEAGAVFKDIPSLNAVCKAILDVLPNFKAISTFDEKGHPIVLKRGEKHFIPKELAKVKPEKIFWLYGQKDITGTDVTLPSFAVAIVFINRHTKLTDLVQAVGRLRKMHAGQCVRILLDPDATAIIKKTLGKDENYRLTYFDIVTYCSINEGQDNGNRNFNSLSKQWDALLEKPFWDNAFRLRHKVLKNFERISSLFVEPTKDDPVHRPCLSKDLLPRKMALAKLQAHYKEKIKSIKSNLANTELNEYFDVRKLYKEMEVIQDGMLYSNLIHYNNDANATQTTFAAATQTNAAQASNQMLVDMQGERVAAEDADHVEENETVQEFTSWSGTNTGRKAVPHESQMQLHPLKSIFKHAMMKEYWPIFKGIDLYISQNSVITLEGDSLDRPGWVNGYVKPLHYIYITPKGLHCIIDKEEASQKIKRLEKGTLYLANQGVVYSTTGLTRVKLIQDPNFLKKELAEKILNGDLTLDEKQKEVLINWLDQDQKKLLLKFVETTLESIHPGLNKTAEYFALKSLLI